MRPATKTLIAQEIMKALVENIRDRFGIGDAYDDMDDVCKEELLLEMEETIFNLLTKYEER